MYAMSRDEGGKREGDAERDRTTMEKNSLRNVSEMGRPCDPVGRFHSVLPDVSGISLRWVTIYYL